MRTTLNAVLDRNKDYKKFKEDYFKNYQGKLEQSIEKLAKKRGEQIKNVQDAGLAGGFVRFGNWIYNIFNRPKVEDGIN